MLDLEHHLRQLCRSRAGQPLCKGVGFRRFSPSPVDARIFFASPRRLDDEDGRAALVRLEEDPWVERLQRKGAGVTLRLGEEYVRGLTEALLAGDAGAADLESLRGRTFVVNFLNPNATKPLHIGHLRNVAIGEALAAGLEASGARVVRQCYVCDIGRNVCEAMAGRESFHAGETPAELGLPSDQFVGRCYAEYVGAMAAGAGLDASELDPVAGEAVLTRDRADELIGAWMAGDPGTLERWRELRTWALDGQARTLARLGVAMDRRHYESTTLERVRSFVDTGLDAGLFRREPEGTVVYDTGRSEYPCVQLVRGDGFPTEHARVIALFLGEQDTAPDIDRWIVVCGDEWDAAGDVELEIAARVGPCPLRPLVDVLTHGMVTLSGSKMKSRDGKALLIDDFLDALLSEPRIRGLLEDTGHPVPPEDVVEIAVKGYFLCRRPSKMLEFRWESFTDEVHNPAWVLARAWCRSADARRRGGALPVDEESVRIAAMQVHQLRQILVGSADGFVGTELAKFAIGLAKWSLDQPAEPRLQGVVHAVLACSLRSLGLSAARSYSPKTSST
jgi:arginyl-tRNA synthetase